MWYNIYTMTTITLPKNVYTEIIKRQERTDMVIARLQKQVEKLARDELRPEVAARLEKQSRLLDAGKGVKLKSMKEYQAFVQSL